MECLGRNALVPSGRRKIAGLFASSGGVRRSEPASDASAIMEDPVARGLWRLGFALSLAVAAELLDFLAPETGIFKAIGMGLAVAAIALAGVSTYRKGLAALRRARFNINALMAVAVTGAFLIGEWPEAAMVMTLYAIAELIEGRALDRARNAIKSLLDLTPETAEVRQVDGAWSETPAADVALDAIVRIKPGARIPLDGTVTTGNSAVLPGETVFFDLGLEHIDSGFFATGSPLSSAIARICSFSYMPTGIKV